MNYAVKIAAWVPYMQHPRQAPRALILETLVVSRGWAMRSTPVPLDGG
jgi:hypothetical protein